MVLPVSGDIKTLNWFKGPFSMLVHRIMGNLLKVGTGFLKFTSVQMTDDLKLSSLLIFQLEKSLKSQIDAWEQENGTEFLVNGQQFLEYVQQQWEKHHEDKEREKLARVRFDSLKSSFTFMTLYWEHWLQTYNYLFDIATEKEQTNTRRNVLWHENTIKTATARAYYTCKTKKSKPPPPRGHR